MSNRSPAPPPETPAEAAYKLDRAVLRAIHTCQPVLFEGKQHHLRAMGAQVLGGGVSSVIYLMGDATPRQPGEITFFGACRMIDLLDLVRSIAAAAARAAENKHYPSPCSQGSPLLASVRQACVERGYTGDGLAVPGMAAPSAQPSAVPEGWTLVPVEPNDAMQTAGAQAVRIDTTVINKIWTGNAVFRAMIAAAPAAPAAQDDAKDACAEMRALCSACGGTGDVHGLDGEWRGQCTCVQAWQQRAEKAEADLKQVNEWRATALAENQTLGELWASKVEKGEARIKELETQLVRRRAPLSPEAQQAIAAARAAGQTIAATPGGLVFINDGVEPDYSKLDCPACGGSGHAGDLAAGSAP